MAIKNIIINCLEKVIEEKIRILVGIIIASLVTLLLTKISEYTVKKQIKKEMPSIILQLSNKTHTTTNIINNKLATLVSQCGEWSGGAWAVYDHKTKLLEFIEVFANDPYYGGVYPTKYIKGNRFYLIEHELDNFAYEKVMNIQEYDVIDMNNDVWQYSRFFQSLQQNIWKVTNDKLMKLQISPVHPRSMYIATVQFNNELIYIFAITVSTSPFCNLTDIIATDNEKIHYTGVALKKLSTEATQLLDIFSLQT